MGDINSCGRRKLIFLSILLVPVLLLLPSLRVFCQDSGFKYFKNYTPAQYDYHPMNWTVLQDNRGVIYVGNHGGLIEYDGVSWRIINIPNWTARSLAIDNNGTIYVGGNNDIGFLTPGANGAPVYKSLLNHVEDRCKNFSYVFGTHCTNEGIYFRTLKYLFRWDNKQVKVWESGDRFDRTFVCKGKFFVHRRKIGLMQMKDDQLELVPGGKRVIGKRITMLAPYGRNLQKLLIGTRTNGFYIYDSKTIEPFPTGVDEYVKEKHLYHGIGISSSPGNFALATLRGGLLIMDSRGDLKGIFNKSRGLLADNVKFVYEDVQGNLWLALEKGIAKIEFASPISIYDDRLELPGLVLAVTKHRTGTREILYAGTTWGLYYLAAAGKFQPVRGISGMCYSLLPVRDSLLAAADPGVFQVENDRIIRKLADARAYVLLKSGRVFNRIWVGTRQGLVSLYRENGSRQWKKELIFKNITTPVRTIVEDPKGNLWLGTGARGVIKVDFPDKGSIAHYLVKRYHTSRGLPPREVSVFWAVDHVMFGTDKGVFRFHEKNGEFVPDFTFGEAFADGSRNVFRIAEAANKHIWFSSQGRNYQAIPQRDGSFAVNGIPFLRIPPTQVNHIYPEDNGDCVWFAANDALFCYDTTFEKIPPRSYEILIRKVMVNGKTALDDFKCKRDKDSGLPGFSLILPFRSRSLRFQCAAPFFENESAIRYRYFLEGYEKNWSDWIPGTQKDYTNLDPGSYRFRAQARNVYGNLSSEAFFLFKILPPWYQTWWAYAAYVLLSVFLFYCAVKWRSRILEKDKRRLQRLIKEATKEIKRKNQLLEDNTARLEIQARELQEMAAVRTRFFTNISHEFRTPLTLIMAPLEQMISRCGDDREKKRLEMMHRNSRRLLTLINQLLALSRIDKGKMKLRACAQNIVSFLKGILASFYLAAAYYKIDLSLSPETDDLTLYFDPEKLEDVFCNLLLNVVNLAPQGGKINVGVKGSQTGTRQDDSPAVPVFLEVSVCVSGLEIPHEQLEHIFDPFYLAEEAYECRPKRHGIGLALAKELVSLHHGEIDARRCRGETEGTMFIIRLPMGKEHLEPEEIVDASRFPMNFWTPREIPVPKIPEKKESEREIKKESKTHENEEQGELEAEEKIIILLVEDNADFREFISDSLKPLYTVEEAANGQEGIKKARELIPDIIITDIIMPVVDGYKLCRELKKDILTSHVPIILLTAKGGEENILRGLETGADDYIVKPFNPKLLHARIKNLIDLRRQWQLKIERQMGLQPADISVSSIDEVFIKELHEAIEKNLSDPEFKVDQLAKKLYMSRASLYRKIRALTGDSPHRFIRSYRLKRAAQLFKANFGNVTEVAMEVGFTNISYFSHCFREKFHQLPSEFLEVESENT